MKKKQFKDIYPIYTTTLPKSDTLFTSVDTILESIKEKIEAHPIAAYIAIFDSHKHTSSLEMGVVSPEIKAAKNILCCFGKELKNPEILSVRPRSIGVADMGDCFHISFLQAPNEAANDAMIAWVTSLKKD